MMGITWCRCVICGRCIFWEDSVSWLSEFRAIYQDDDGVHISGVGHRDHIQPDTLAAPPDSATHWTQKEKIDHENVDHDTWKLFEPYYDFFLHDVCWDLLRIFIPEGFSLRRFREILKSVPLLMLEYGLAWDHLYGGGLAFDTQAHYPWEDLRLHTIHSELTSNENPCEKFDVKTPASSMTVHLTHRSLPPAEHHDHFSRLPMEIIEAVASFLSTRDALNLRLVSKATTCLFFSSSFWASRFQTWGERGFVYEARQARGIDWLTLYRRTGDKNISVALHNRKRIWSLIRSLAQLLGLNLAGNSNLYFPKPADYDWSKVQGDIRYNSAFKHQSTIGSQSLAQRIIPVPHNLSSIAFSRVDIGKVSYITGLQIRDSEGGSIEAGYLGGSQTVECRLKLLKGFIVAIGTRGVHALRVLNENEELSDWVGDPDDTPRTRRLAIADVVEAVKIDFDGFKLVSLSVSAQGSARSPSLRQAALWYPTVPPSSLFLNDTAFAGANPLQIGYQPLCWIHFGGPEGEHLKDITGISYLDGRYDQIRHPELPFWAIDGAAGERIEAIEASLKSRESSGAYPFLKHGTLIHMKLTTNRQRTLSLGSPVGGTSHSTLSIEPNTTITGLYASKHAEYGLINLGVISEHVKFDSA